MFVKPRSAFVGKPSVVASSSGRAKKALYARLLPSTRKSSASRAGASGCAALDDGRVVGYLIAWSRPGERWGPNVWVEAAGHAATEPEIVRDLYACAADRWVERGLTSHFALVPATDAGLVDAWFRLGFGAQS